MCDRDYFEEDRQEYDALGLVTRKQFGIMSGAGVAMMLPRVANAVTVTETDVTVSTPDGAADCYFVHPASGMAPGVLVAWVARLRFAPRPPFPIGWEQSPHSMAADS